MGGPGSGQWSRGDKAPTLDDLLSLDIRLLRRRGMLAPGSRRMMSWSRGEQSAGSVWVLEAEGSVILVYLACVGLGPWEDKRDHIFLDWTTAPRGGQRPWFLCPACTRRVALLYSTGTGFVCRHCTQRPYGSQCESPLDRQIRKVRKIRTRLGVSHNLLESIHPWHKPRGMHWHTFERLQAQEAHAQLAVWHHQHVWSTRYLEQHGEESAEGGEARASA